MENSDGSPQPKSENAEPRAVQVAVPSDSADFNDVLSEKRGWEHIVDIIDAAAPLPPLGVAFPRKAGQPSDVSNRSARKVAQKPRRARSDGGRDTAATAETRAAGPPTALIAAPAGGGAGGPPHGEDQGLGGADGDGLNLRLAFYPHTDLGNAERFRERCRGKLLWCPGNSWHAWNGRFWRRDGAEERVTAAEHDTVRAIQDEADALCASGRDVRVGTRFKGKTDEEPIMMSDSLVAWGRASEQASRLAPIAKRAATYLAVEASKLDADPFKINLANGTLVIRKPTDGSRYVNLEPHNPADLLTKCSPVVFDPAATCPTFDRFLSEVQPDKDFRRFLLQWQGLSLTGDVSEQKLCIFWGGGKNGKSTFIDICAHIAGDYSKTVPIETFLNDGRGRSAGQASPDLAMLPGVRHLRTSEPERGAKLAEALIKLATGGEPILARHLRKDFFEFYPQFKLTISGNHKPKIGGADEGIWRRVIFVPWSVTVPKDKVDPHLSDKLKLEASGILNRLLDGLCDWLDNGLCPPADVLDATAEYRRDSDPGGQFLEECVVAAAGERVRATDMHLLHCAWARANGEREWSAKGLSSALKDHGLRNKQSNGMWWLDVKLTKSVTDFGGDGEAKHDTAPTTTAAVNDEVVF